jgi:hypothetical protein
MIDTGDNLNGCVRVAPGEATNDALPAPERRRNRIPEGERDRLGCA